METRYRFDRGSRKLTDEEELAVFNQLEVARRKVVAVAAFYDVSHQTIYAAKSRTDEMIWAAIASGEAHASVAGRLGLTVEIVKAAEKRAQTRKDNLAKSRTSLTR